MAETAGPYLKEAKASIAEQKLEGITDANTKVDIEISQRQIFRSLVANLCSRMETTALIVGMNRRARGWIMHKYNNLLAIIEVLNKDNWMGKEQDESNQAENHKFSCCVDRMHILCEK